MKVRHTDDRTNWTLHMDHLEAVHTLEALREMARTYRQSLERLADTDFLDSALDDTMYYSHSLTVIIKMIWELEHEGVT